MLYGYARVSTQDQELDLQVSALQEYGCEKVFADKSGGETLERPELKKLKETLTAGDHIVCWKLDRLFRSTIDALTQIEQWSSEGVLFTCITQSLSTSDDSATGKLLRTVLMAFAEFERDLIRERTKAGLAAARCRGVKLGRPTKLTSDQLEVAQKLIEEGATVSKVARTFKVSRATLHRRLAARRVVSKG